MNELNDFYFRERVIVTLKSITITEINDIIINIARGSKHVYLSTNSICTSSREI